MESEKQQHNKANEHTTQNKDRAIDAEIKRMVARGYFIAFSYKISEVTRI